MLRLTFHGVLSSLSFECEPSQGFRFEGGTIRDADGRVVASFAGGSWAVGDHYYTRLVCTGPVVVRFENPAEQTSAACGTFPQVSVFGPAMKEGGEYLAILSNGGTWRSHRTGGEWPVVALSSD